METKPKISLVIPVFNEEEVIPELLRRIEVVAKVNQEEFDLEVILVDDGSKDESAELIRKTQSELEIRLIQFSRNFGHQAAVMSGIAKANGDAVVIMDADLQDPPELILELVKLWGKGFHVVYGKRISRTGESLFKKISASAFYKFLHWLTDVDIPLDTGDFRLIDRKVVDSLTGLNEKSLFIRGLIAWMGFKQCPMEYHREVRFAGKTKYPLKRMVALAADAILAFSEKPLRLISKIGGSIFLIAVLTSVLVLLATFYNTGYQAPGWLSLMLVLLIFSGFQILCLGVIGSYVLRIYRQTKNRPIYIVMDEFNNNH